MKLGQFRDYLEDYCTLPDSAEVHVLGEDRYGREVEMRLVEIFRCSLNQDRPYLVLRVENE